MRKKEEQREIKTGKRRERHIETDIESVEIETGREAEADSHRGR